MITIAGRNQAATYDEIAEIHLSEPRDKGRYWVGVKHSDVLDAVHDELRSRHWRILYRQFTLSNDTQVMAGAWNIDIPDLQPPPGVLFSLGVVNGNDRHHKLRLAAGGVVTVCQNGLVMGEFTLAAKHTSGLDLQRAVAAAMDSYAAAARRMDGEIAALRSRRIADGRQPALLVDAGRQKLMPWSRLGTVDKLYRQPKNDFTDVWGVGTYWSLLNCFTYVAKRNPPIEQIRQINGFRRLLVADMDWAAC